MTRLKESTIAPVNSMIENMSFFRCPDTGKEHLIFGPSYAQEVAVHANTSVIARLPIDPKIAELCDTGQVEQTSLPEIEEIAQKLISS
ncbi:MAG: hypothetical protein CVU46_10190 [Chloroflexi bacterium HGW-Chloroflexi-8]|nr:MAG: hypothetical protein CVU46_10190 [Chloroflexi bacterium HGW-Chloroflexi-8]